MSFLTMDMQAIRLSMNTEDRIKADIKDLQARGRELNNKVMNTVQSLHIITHISLTALVLFGVYSLGSIILDVSKPLSSNIAVLTAVFLTLVFSMIKKDSIINPILEEITSFITKDKLEEIDQLKNMINNKAEQLIKLTNTN